MESSNKTLAMYGADLVRFVRPILIFVAVIWIVEFIDWLFFGGRLDQFGIIPRQVGALKGILFAPILHINFQHVLANTVPLIVLGLLVNARNGRNFWAITAMIAGLSGLAIWLLGPSQTVHVGASAVIFGFFGFLLGHAFYERSAASIAIAALVIVLYGGMLVGLLPQGNGISWQGHLFGLLSGLATARFFHRTEEF